MQPELSKSSVEVAQRLLGSWLVRELEGQVLVGKIVETEAYDRTDAASHSFKGKTPRTDVLFGPPGRAYVYFTYGMHYCMNVVTGKQGQGSAVLIRALEPLEGIGAMRTRRQRISKDAQLLNGPAKLCQAFGINRQLNGHDLQKSPLQVVLQPSLPTENIVQTTRVGITRDTHRLWRFYVQGSPFISRP
jgi:DNA-3-methyladenine glycosylase